MLKCLVIVGALSLSGCTAGQAIATAQKAGAAAENYVHEHVQTRIEFRANIKETILAEYRSLMRAADTAERTGDMGLAREYWSAARQLMNEEMPDLKKIRERVEEFFENAP